MLPPIESIQCFLAAARLLNFRAAARTVSLTPAALGKRIQQLEQHLGTKLFERTTRKVQLTQAGLSLIPYAQALIMAAEDCVRAGRGDFGPASMDITLGTRYELGLSWLTPMLDPLHTSHPHITTHLYFSSGPDLELRVRTFDIDCAVTSRLSTDPKLDSIRLHREDYTFIASPKLLQHTPFQRPEDAQHHTLIDAHAELPLFRYWSNAEHAPTLSFQNIRRMGTIAAIRALALQGLGVAVLPTYMIQPDLDAKTLVSLFPEVQPAHDFFRLLFRRDDPRRSVYQTFADTMMSFPLQ